MKNFVKLTKNPLTWILFIGVGIICAIIWALKKAKKAVD